MKKLIGSMIVVFVLCMAFGVIGLASASTTPKLYVNQQEVFSDVPPFIKNDTTLVPLAVISNGLGYNVVWDNVKKEVTVSNHEAVIQLAVGKTTGLVNGKSHELLVAPSLEKSRTFVPIRFISEVLGMNVDWNQNTYEIHISSKEVKPVVQTGTIESIHLTTESELMIQYTGKIDAPSAMMLSNPKRLVLDFQNAGYTKEIESSFVHGQATVTTEGYPYMSKYRYSIFNNNPLVARVVIELHDEVKYQVTNDETNGMYIVTFGETMEEEEPTEEVKPTLPVDDGIYHIVIDAGHGNGDSGAVSKLNGKYEKTFNLSLALKLRDQLQNIPNVQVHMTRSDDTFLELSERVAFAENIPGINQKADLFISIHANSFDKNTVQGTETYYYHSRSKNLAETLHPYLLKGAGLKDRGVKTAGFKVIKDTTMPSVLLEVGYLSNENDVKQLFDEKVQHNIAVQLANGIKEFLGIQ